MARDPEKLERWIKDHPVQANLYAIGICILIFEVAGFLQLLGKYLDHLKGAAR